MHVSLGISLGGLEIPGQNTKCEKNNLTSLIVMGRNITDFGNE